MTRERIRLILGAFLMLLIGWGAAYFYFSHKPVAASTILRENSPEYKFINPLLLVDSSGDESPELDSLKKSISNTVEKDKENNLASDVSVYFRDLNSSKWTGVNEYALYAPSSMLKLVTLLAFLNAAQDEPELLTQKVYFVDTPDPGQYFKPQSYLPTGSYTVRDLLIQMITQSDNAAMDLLNGMRPDKIQSVYKELALPSPLTSGDDFMSAVEYSRIFRTLYNSTYLSRPYSEEALQLLSYTHFNYGLGDEKQPKDVTTADKFGEHTLLDPDGNPLERELHDCGIVYYPGKPYFLCVMTKGADFIKLKQVISDVFTVTYTYIKK